MAVVKNIMLKKGNMKTEKQYYLPLILRLFGRLSSGEEGKGTEFLGRKSRLGRLVSGEEGKEMEILGRKMILKSGGGEDYQAIWKFYTALAK